jgi:hypothetical protein
MREHGVREHGVREPREVGARWDRREQCMGRAQAIREQYVSGGGWNV